MFPVTVSKRTSASEQAIDWQQTPRFHVCCIVYDIGGAVRSYMDLQLVACSRERRVAWRFIQWSCHIYSNTSWNRTSYNRTVWWNVVQWLDLNCVLVLDWKHGLPLDFDWKRVDTKSEMHAGRVRCSWMGWRTKKVGGRIFLLYLNY